MPIIETTPNPANTGRIIVGGSKSKDYDVRSLAAQNTWLLSLNQAIDACGQLTKGWDSYDAEPPNSVSVLNARSIALKCAEVAYEPAKVLPSVEGGIALIFDSRNKYADIECFNTGEIFAVTSDRKKEPDVWSVEQNAVERTLERIREFFER